MWDRGGKPKREMVDPLSLGHAESQYEVRKRQDACKEMHAEEDATEEKEEEGLGGAYHVVESAEAEAETVALSDTEESCEG